jgi:DNA polymerase III delta prime subunit
MKDDFLWVEKYRPQTIEDCILPEETKNTFQSFVNTGEIPNLLLCGTAGIGKTTVAKALCNELNVDYYVINGSDEGRFLDTVRNNAKQFASTVSLTSTAKHKVIIIDEADNTTHDVQLLLRASIEEFAGNCRFIFTCNYKNKIIAPLHSRCSVVDFSIGKADKQKIAANFFNRIRSILEGEGVTFDPKVLAEVVQKYFPDFRRTLNELQRYSVSGTIDTGLLANIAEVRMESLIDALKNKEFSVARKWVNSNLDNDPNVVLRSIYENLYHVLEPVFIPQAVLIIAKYQYQSAFVADQEINLLAALTEIMVECKFK